MQKMECTGCADNQTSDIRHIMCTECANIRQSGIRHQIGHQTSDIRQEVQTSDIRHQTGSPYGQMCIRAKMHLGRSVLENASLRLDILAATRANEVEALY